MKHAQLLGRTLHPLTQTWAAPGLTPISAEVMSPLEGPAPTLLEVLDVLIKRDTPLSTQPPAGGDLAP